MGGIGTPGGDLADQQLVTVTEAVLPLLRRSSAPRIVNVSSSAGSLTKLSDLDDPDPVALGYVTSKTALTALTLQYAKGLRDGGILVNAVNPGFVATDLNNHAGHSPTGVRGTTCPAAGRPERVVASAR